MEINPIMKVADKGCNLDCNYCFYNKQTRGKKIMSLEILEMVIKEACEHNKGDVIFIWHGGEPLLAGIAFYQKAFELQERYRKPSQRIINSIQTNGTLINDRWGNIFKQRDVIVGISLDGPKDLHDKHRHFSDGKGSFEKIMCGIEFLRSSGVDFAVISVVTQETIEASNEVLNFLISQNPMWINFVPSLAISNGSTLLFEQSIQPSEYIDFLIRIFEFWLKNGDYRVKILPIETIICGFLEKEHREHRLVGECKKRLAVRSCEKNLVIIPNGDVKTCSFHSYGDVFKFGNIRVGLDTILNSSAYQQYQEHLRTIKERCSNCRWYRVCPNGCPRDFHIGGSDGLFCKELPRLFQFIQEELGKYPITREWS